MAEVLGFQLSGRRGVGDGDFRSGLSVRPALGAAGAGYQALRHDGGDYRAAGGGILVVAQPARELTGASAK
ncbi:hypothetical protein SBA2_570006 [Acidobacteriia bacterium SbA2]|nr:hypothetical protein SBA2_570006 [Acidobacteriia bacterium SbA2]